jgi:cell division septation protein DedD
MTVSDEEAAITGQGGIMPASTGARASADVQPVTPPIAQSTEPPVSVAQQSEDQQAEQATEAQAEQPSAVLTGQVQPASRVLGRLPDATAMTEQAEQMREAVFGAPPDEELRHP